MIYLALTILSLYIFDPFKRLNGGLWGKLRRISRNQLVVALWVGYPFGVFIAFRSSNPDMAIGPLIALSMGWAVISVPGLVILTGVIGWVRRRQTRLLGWDSELNTRLYGKVKNGAIHVTKIEQDDPSTYTKPEESLLSKFPLGWEDFE